jgi:hypothetical protein
VLTGDFNGDGKTDLAHWLQFCCGQFAWQVALSTGSSFAVPPSLGGIWIEFLLHGSEVARPEQTATGDFNGDGKTDLAFWFRNGKLWNVALSTGTRLGTNQQPPDSNWIRGFGGAPAIMLIGDFNGDHRTDLAGWNDVSEAWHVALSTGQGFDPSAGFWITNFGHPGAMIVGDFGGSGRTSIGTYLYDSTTEQPILTTNYSNPSYDTSRISWASNVCGGQTFFRNAQPPYEWMQVLDPSSERDDIPVGISGIALSPDISSNDVPFTHPFGFDWDFYVAPDPQYRPFLAYGNNGPRAQPEYVKATTRARMLGLWVPDGVLGAETDQDLIPPTYRAMEGDRVLVFGRWIADCGHDDFHSEIHPPWSW